MKGQCVVNATTLATVEVQSDDTLHGNFGNLTGTPCSVARTELRWGTPDGHSFSRGPINRFPVMMSPCGSRRLTVPSQNDDTGGRADLWYVIALSS